MDYSLLLFLLGQQKWRGLKVPEVLISGHAKKIEDWRYEQALQRTKALRPD